MVSQANLNVKLSKKLGGKAGGLAKNLGGHGPPGPPLESPLGRVKVVNFQCAI